MKRVIASLALMSLLGCSEAAKVGVLRVCLGEADSPRADATAGGFDVEVAGLLADALNRQLTIIWLPRPQMTEIESSDINFGPLLQGRCDLMLSIPGEPALDGFRDRLLLSRPYYGTAFELIPEDGELREGNRIAVRANTVAHIVVDALGFEWTMQSDSAAIADTVAIGAADAGLIWGPELALVDAERNEEFAAPALLRWNQHMAIGRANEELLEQLNAFIDTSEGEILGLLTSHGIPPHLPWTSIHQPEALRDL